MENKKQRRRRGREKPLKSVPEDLIPEIISRVPANDLMRFTRVSKSWSSLICTDSYFARLQLERAASLDPFLLIEEVEVADKWSYYNYSINLDSIDDENINLEEIDNPFDDDDNYAQVVGFCNGLLAFRKTGCILKTAVSNPTTKIHVTVPPPNPARNIIVVFCGFGYDHVHDCYKLVAQVMHIDGALELMVYDLNKGTWRTLQFGMWWKLQYQDLDDTECFRNLDDYSVKCVDGVVCWCIDLDKNHMAPNRSREMRMMVCFLLAEEEFHVVKPPDLGEVKYYPNMTLLDGRLGLVCQGLDRRHEFWSIQLDFVGGKRQWQWTKLLAISDPKAMLPRYIERPHLIPVCFSACRSKILILVQYQLFWYDIGKREFRELKNHPIYSCCYRARTFVPSLVGIELL